MKQRGFFFLRGVVACALFPAAVWAAPLDGQSSAEVDFDSGFLMHSGGATVDVSRFTRGNPVTPGEYSVDIYLNASWIGRRAVRFEGPDGQATPCFDGALIAQLNLKNDLLGAAPERLRADLAKGQCVDLGQLVAGASASFDIAELRMDISAPQAALRHAPQGYVNPEFWDQGVPSATLAYNLNTYQTSGLASGRTSYAAFDSGLNLGAWHFRQRSALSWQTGGQRQYQNIATYLQHDLPSWRSQLTLGDSYTDGAMFDSIGLRGAQLASDDRMLPDSQRGYAPLIRGIAQSNARVTVTQNGVKLHETTVSPGPFEVNDLYATGYGGDLLVTVTEADGSQHSFTVPYASVAQLLRPGTLRYTVALGKVRNVRSIGDDSKLLQATMQYGFTNLLTGYGGAVAAQGYQAGLLGTAWNTPMGAVALDVTQSRISKPGLASSAGRSIRVSYSKFVPSTRTNLAIAGYRYSSSGYWGLREAVLVSEPRSRLAGSNGFDYVPRLGRQRNALQLTVNQSLGEKWGELYATGSSSDYWTRSGRSTEFQVGYSNTFRAFGTNLMYNIAASRRRDGITGTLGNQVYASVSIPLGSEEHPATLSLAASRDGRTGSSGQLMLTGSALDDNALSYGVNVDRALGASTGGGNVQYRGQAATLSASASGGSGYTQYSGGIKGAIVAHPGGVTLANDLSDTVGVVEAKDAMGARIANAPGVRIDGRGYAVIPYLRPYSLNSIDLDPMGLPLDVELKETSTRIAPRANTVTMIRFATVAGRSAMIGVMKPDGVAPPFGAIVLNEAGSEVGVVGQGGRVLVRGVADEGDLTLRWGEASDQVCHFGYRLPERDGQALTYPRLDVKCETYMGSGPR
ncbi:fimbria/pilus outer membrane usher protein [Achromobacter aegrifaciens]